MPNDSPPKKKVTYTSEFKRNLKQLAKKYRKIRSDLDPIIDQLADGHRPGDQVAQVKYEVFKVRVKNSDSQKGKSGGYRVIYYLKSELEVVLITIYSKSEQADIGANDIRSIILEFDAAPGSEVGFDSQQKGAEPEQSSDDPGGASPA